MARQRFCYVILMAILAGSFLSVGLETTFAAQKTYNLTIAHGMIPTIPTTPMWELMKKRLEENSKGQIKVKLFAGASLCNEGSCMEQIRQGAVDMVSISTGNYGAFSNNFYVLDMPYVFTSFEGAKKAATGRIGDILKKRSEDKDKIKCLAIISSYAFRNFYNNIRECRVPADTTGIKIRTVLSPIETNLVKGWGATPLNVPWGELYQALQTKVVNGFYIPDGYTYHQKFYEVTPYCTETGGLFNFHLMFMDLKKFQSLPAELQKVIEKAAKEVELAEYDLDLKWSKDAKAKMQQAGVKFYTPTPEEKKLWLKPAMGIWEQFKDKVYQDLLKEMIDMQK